jgi:RHS repeat-associated protein
VDLEVQTEAGRLRFIREWNGVEWRFQPGWESLSENWKNLTGSQTADTTAPKTTGEGKPLLKTSAPPPAAEGCWVWVDDGWEPSGQMARVSPSGEIEGIHPVERSTPFNQIQLTVGTQGGARYVSLDYALLCGGMIGVSRTTMDGEGIRKGGELYLGRDGRYAFNDRYILEKTTIRQPARQSEAELGGGQVTLTLEESPGYRWSQREGNWSVYDEAGQLMGYGDGNDNTLWLLRDTAGILRSVADGTGKILLRLHYDAKGRLVEIKDNAAGDEQLAERNIKYAYDDWNRLVKVTDLRGHETTYAYDGQSRLTEIRDPLGRTERLEYRNREVTKRILADGREITYRYDYDEAHQQFISRITWPETASGERREVQTHNRVGQRMRKEINGLVEEEIQRDWATRRERVTNARGYATFIKKNSVGQIIEEEYADGSVIKRQYGFLHLELLEETDELGVKTTYQYDGKGNLTKKTEAAGTAEERVTETERNAKGQISKITRKGRTETNGTTTPDASWQIAYDQRGQISQTTDPEGYIRRYVYDRAGNLREATDAKGNTTRFEVDAAGNLTKVIDPLGHTQSYAYDEVGNLTSETDARGKARQRAYDAMNRLTQATNALGGTQQISYNQAGLPEEMTDEDGRKQQWNYDHFWRLTKETDGLGNITAYRYEIPDGTKTGLLGSLDNPAETNYPTFTQEQRFDRMERLTSQSFKYKNTQGEQTSTRSLTYDKRGQVIGETDANGKTRSHRYDALGQRIETTDALGGKTAFGYDARGNLIEVTDAKGNTYRFEYDRNNRLVKEILPLGQTTQYQYDANGKLLQKTTPNGHQATYSYDANNRPTGAVYTRADGSPERTTTYTWDGNGNLTGLKEIDHGRNETVNASYAYDDENRKTQETVTYPDGHSRSYRYAYSLAGKKTQLTWPDGTNIGYGYSDHGELKSVTLPNEGTIQINEYGWLLPKKTTLPGGTTQDKSYDGLLNLESLKVQSNTETLSLANLYGKEQELNKRSRTETANTSASKTETFAYDEELRLTEAQTEGWLWNDTETFTLDGVGNRVQYSESNNPWKYDENNRLIQIGEGSCGSANIICYEYDAAGNRTKKVEGSKQIHYKYDTQNRLVEVSQNTGGTEQLIARYGYDPFNRRIWKEQYGDKDGQALPQARRTYFLYSDEGLLAEETQDITLNGDGSVTATSQPSLTTQYGPRPDSHFTTGILFIKTKNSNGEDTIAYYHHDHLNTPIQATDKAGNVVWSAMYHPFGRVAITTPSPAPGYPVITSNLRFPGQYEDEETGLYYNWNRYYSPEEGRYVTQDPIGLEGGINPYLYVGANPLMFYDPYGLFMDPIWGAIYNATGGGTLPQWAVDGAAGFGDTLTLSITSRLRDLAGIDGGVNKCSKSYKVGGLVAIAMPLGYGVRNVKRVLPNFKEWARDPFWYEIGSKTVTDKLFNKLGTMSPAQRGRAIVNEIGWIKTIFSPRGNWRRTLPTGPTPGGLIGTFGFSAAGLAYWSYNNCECP